MMAIAAKKLGINCIVYDPSPNACAQSHAELVVGSYIDAQALLRFANRVDVVTFEFENVPAVSLDTISSIKPIHPNSHALRTASDRIAEKQFFEKHNIPIGPYQAISGGESLRKACAKLGLPAVLKSCSGGYDGKGQFVIHTEDELENAIGQIGDLPFIFEAFVPFERELSVIACRSSDGELVTYSLTQNTHQHGILVRSEAPAIVNKDIQAQAMKIAQNIADGLDYVGVFAVELFDVNGKLLANEMSPRVHNSGHWTIEGAQTSQFENHVRAVMGLDLRPTDSAGHSIMLNIIGALPRQDSIAEFKSAAMHAYAKAPRAGRKIGHITVNSADTDECRTIAANIQSRLCNAMPGGEGGPA